MNSKQLYSKHFQKYILEESKLKQLQEVELLILRDIKKACEANNLKYMLSGGSVLGAVRHNGFIPWDDDIDIMMYREDYKKLGKAIQEMFGDKYTVVSNDTDKNCVFKMMKVYLNNTKYIEIETENYPTVKEVFVDVLPLIICQMER